MTNVLIMCCKKKKETELKQLIVKCNIKCLRRKNNEHFNTKIERKREK